MSSFEPAAEFLRGTGRFDHFTACRGSIQPVPGTVLRKYGNVPAKGTPGSRGASTPLRLVDRPWSPRLRFRSFPTSLSPLRSRRRCVEPPAAPCVHDPGGASERNTPSERACVFSGATDGGREKHPPVKAARDGGRNVARKGVSC